MYKVDTLHLWPFYILPNVFINIYHYAFNKHGFNDDKMNNNKEIRQSHEQGTMIIFHMVRKKILNSVPNKSPAKLIAFQKYLLITRSPRFSSNEERENKMNFQSLNPVGLLFFNGSTQ